MHEDVVGEADLLVESLPALVAGVGPHAAVGEAETADRLNLSSVCITQLFQTGCCIFESDTHLCIYIYLAPINVTHF